MFTFDDMEELFGGYSWMFGVIVTLFIIIFVAVLVSIIVAIVRKNGRHNNMTKGAPPPHAPQRKVRSDIDPFGLSDTPDAPFADFGSSDEMTCAAMTEIAAAQNEPKPPENTENLSFCPYCGAPRETGKFCPFCGNKYDDKD